MRARRIVAAVQKLSYNMSASGASPVLCPHSQTVPGARGPPNGGTGILSIPELPISKKRLKTFRLLAFHAQHGRCFYFTLPTWLASPNELGLRPARHVLTNARPSISWLAKMAGKTWSATLWLLMRLATTAGTSGLRLCLQLLTTEHSCNVSWRRENGARSGFTG